MKRYTLTDGLVIKRSSLPSGDVVVTLLGRDGKLRAIARKGKLPGGNLGRLSLFHDVTVQFYRRSDDDLALLTQVELNGALPGLTSPSVYPLSHLLCELADALTVDLHLETRIYDYLTSALRGLNTHHDPEKVALLYAWRLLTIAGLGPQLRRCAVCLNSTEVLAFSAEAGGVTCGEHRSGVALSACALAELGQLVLGSMAEALTEPLTMRTLHWRILEEYVAHHVHPLRSFTSAMRSLAGGPSATAKTTDPIGGAA